MDVRKEYYFCTNFTCMHVYVNIYFFKTSFKQNVHMNKLLDDANGTEFFSPFSVTASYDKCIVFFFFFNFLLVYTINEFWKP